MAKVTEKLTQSQCERAKPKEKDYKLVDGGGLYLLVKANGSKLFYYKKQRNGKIYNYALGNLKDITLKEVRVLANKKLAEVESISQKTELKALKITFAEVWEEWIENEPKQTKADLELLSRRKFYFKSFFKSFANEKMRDITSADIIRALDDYRINKQKASFKKAKTAISKCFDYGITMTYCDDNPAKKISLEQLFRGIKTKNYAYLKTIDEVIELKKRVINSTSITPPLRRLFLFQLYTATRPSEARLAQWQEIDLQTGVWTIPEHKMKMEVEHTVTLSSPILKMIKELDTHPHSKEDYIFKNSRNDKEYSENAINTMLKRLGYAKEELTPHGLRGTFSTILNDKLDEHGLSSDIIEACLAHSIGNRTARSYNHAQYEKQKAKLLEYWGNLLGDII